MKKKTGIIIGIVCSAVAVAVLIGSMGAGAPHSSGDGYYYNDYSNGSFFQNFASNYNISLTNALGNSLHEHSGEDDRAVIANAGISLQTKMYDACTAALKAKLKELEGYAEVYNEENYESGRQARILARVPSKKLDVFLDSLAENAVVIRKTSSFSDVTDTLIDTESKKKALETERDALLKLMDRADNIDEIIRVQNRLSDVRGDLESYLKKLQDLKSQMAYSSVEITISEVDRISTPSQKFGALASSGFLNSVKRIGAGFRNFALWMIAAVPYLVLLAVPVTVGAILLKRSHKKRAEKRAAREL